MPCAPPARMRQQRASIPAEGTSKGAPPLCSGSSNRGEQQPCWHTTLPAKSSMLYLCGPLTLQGDGPGAAGTGVSKGAIAHAMTSLQAPFVSPWKRPAKVYLRVPGNACPGRAEPPPHGILPALCLRALACGLVRDHGLE